MGWASGSSLMGEIIDGLKAARLTRAQRRAVYRILIPAFEFHDCDTLDECRDDDKEFEAILDEIHPLEEDYYPEDEA